MAKKSSGNGIREISPGKFVATMYDPRARGNTKHIGTFAVGDRYKTRTEARKAAQEAKAEAETLRDLQLKAPEVNETVASFAGRWMRDYPRDQETTNRHNEERVQAFVRDFGERPMREIEVVEARAWIVGGIVPPQVRTVAKGWEGARNLPDGDVMVPGHRGNLSAVRAMYHDALRTELVQRNPFAKLGLPQSQGRKGDAITLLSEGEVVLIVETAIGVLGSEYGRHFGALIETAAWTGLRPGELWALNVQDDPNEGNTINFQTGEIRVDWQIDRFGSRRLPKWNSQRTVFMLPPALGALRRAIGDRDYGPVWLTKRDMSRLSGRTLSYYWNEVRTAFWGKLPPERQSQVTEKEGGPEPGKIASDFDFYELRHFFGSQLAEMRMHPTEIADQMGHKDGGKLAMERYIHPRRESVKRSMLERYADHERRKKLGEADDAAASG